jgi:cysteine-rich repeat protein
MRMVESLPRLGALITLGAVVGCSVFDPALYQNRDGAADAPPVPLAERCEDDPPAVLSRTTPFIVDTTNMADNINSEINVCTGANEAGNDGFFAVDMVQGERWHFHVKALTEGINPAVYVLRTCDARVCMAGSGLDECSNNNEHLSFVALNTARYVVGIDARNPGGGRFEITAIRPDCGNSVAEHSEACDDGNHDNGDGCDQNCRQELRPPTANEREANDDALGANVVLLPATGGSLVVRGDIGGSGRCDFDTFAVAVPTNGTITAALFDVNDALCPANSPPLRLAFVDTDGRTELGHVEGTTATPCPSIGTMQTFAQRRSAGTYFLRLTTMNGDAMPFVYHLRIELTP